MIIDLQEPIVINEASANKQEAGHIRAQVRLLSMMMHNIKQIYKLSDELAMQLRIVPSHHTYDKYIAEMARIYIGLLQTAPLLYDAFPAFCNGRLVKLIKVHMLRQINQIR